MTRRESPGRTASAAFDPVMHPVAVLLAILTVTAILALMVARRARSRPRPLSDPGAYARLLLFELELHHTEILERARERGSILPDLAAEIARARIRFQARVPPERRGTAFDDAVVEVLAKGDRSLLGGRAEEPQRRSGGVRLTS